MSTKLVPCPMKPFWLEHGGQLSHLQPRGFLRETKSLLRSVYGTQTRVMTRIIPMHMSQGQVRYPQYTNQIWPQNLCAHVMLIIDPRVWSGRVMSTLAPPALPCSLPCRLVRLSLWLSSGCLLKAIALVLILCPSTCWLVRLPLLRKTATPVSLVCMV